ncbi:MAG: sulfate ABC transporter permease subunit CysW [bacterium]
MAGALASVYRAPLGRPALHRGEPAWVRRLLIAFCLLFLGAFLVLPLVLVFTEALGSGLSGYWNAISNSEALHAVKLSAGVALVSVVLNTLFGVLAAWALTKFDFRGKRFLNALIDLPLTVSPVIAGLLFVLVFGLQGWFGHWLRDRGLSILFAWPGIVLATAFVTFPYVARELIPLMEELGRDEEEAAMVLGAGGWQIFRYVTLPNIRWGLLYGVILCNARALGEFGAVSVVSGHIRGLTNTLPLHVELLYDDYQFSAAFAVASLLTFVAFFTLLLKIWSHRNQTRLMASVVGTEGA